MTKYDYTLTRQELIAYLEGKPSPLDKIWADIVSQLPLELQQEAQQRGYQVYEVGSMNTKYTRTLELVPKEGDPRLNEYITGIYNRVLLDIA